MVYPKITCQKKNTPFEFLPLIMEPPTKRAYHKISYCDTHVNQTDIISKAVHQQTANQAQNHSQIFVAAETHNVKGLHRRLDTQDLHHQPNKCDFDDEPSEGRAGLDAENLGRELFLDAEANADEEEIGDEGHDGNVEVGRVHVQFGRHLLGLRVLDGPVFVEEGKEEEGDLLGHVGCVHRKVELEFGY